MESHDARQNKRGGRELRPQASLRASTRSRRAEVSSTGTAFSRRASIARPSMCQRRELVVEPRTVADHPPANVRLRHPGGGGERARYEREAARRSQPDDLSLALLERVAIRRADGLEDVGLHARRRAGTRPRTGRRGARRPRAPRSEAGARPRSPAATARKSSASRANDSWKAAQCSRSTARRSRSPSGAQRRAPGAARDRLAPRLGVVQPGRQQPRQRGGDQQVVEVAGEVLLDPLPLVVVEHRAPALLEHASRARVDHDQPGAAEVAAVAPASARGRSVGARARTRSRSRPAVVGVLAPRSAGRRRRGSSARGCRCAGRSSRTRAPATMRSAHQSVGAHLLDPALRDVPVVVDVVVVEDHRRRDRGQQPADGRVAPGLPVEPRVLLEVGARPRPAARACRAGCSMNARVSGETSSA